MSSQTTEDLLANQEPIQKMESITSHEVLRKVLGKPAKILEKRVQSSLDHFSIEFIEHTSAAVLATQNAVIPMQFIDCQKETPFILDQQRLNLSLHFREKEIEPTTVKASLYFMASGIGHSLRVNGRLHVASNKQVEFLIDGIYFHCARAATRANFWERPLGISATDETRINDLTPLQFLSHSPYVLMKTQNRQASTDISPRGDAPGFIHQISSNMLLIPERPGNKVAVSLSNIIDQPQIELLCLIPETSKTLNISGRAIITKSPSLLATCAVNGKHPKLGILVTIEAQRLLEDSTLAKMNIWQTQKYVDPKAISSFPKALSAHMNGTGLLGLATAKIVKTVVNHDMKNLY